MPSINTSGTPPRKMAKALSVLVTGRDMQADTNLVLTIETFFHRGSLYQEAMVGKMSRHLVGLFQLIGARREYRLSRDTLPTTMFNVILYQPEIPPNTGNIIRLCANTGVRLHLVKPLGFSLEDKQLLRAGLDYHEFATLTVYDNWSAFAERFKDNRLFAVSTRNQQRYDRITYTKGDAFLFGPETSGLPTTLLESFAEEQRIRLPMLPESRSLNLSNAVAVIVYEAWRQIGFETGF
jgi:tRNA (cytidine/uridine-2'-O-)-methyltransferase